MAIILDNAYLESDSEQDLSKCERPHLSNVANQLGGF